MKLKREGGSERKKIQSLDERKLYVPVSSGGSMDIFLNQTITIFLLYRFPTFTSILSKYTIWCTKTKMPHPLNHASFSQAYPILHALRQFSAPPVRTI